VRYDISEAHHRRRQEDRERAALPSEGSQETHDAAETTLGQALWLSSWILDRAWR
jgi:hypothetical protein